MDDHEQLRRPADRAARVGAPLEVPRDRKVDRGALPAPRAAVAAEHVAPRTELERTIATQWQELLGLDRAVGVHDNFFDLGGHSLLAARAIVRLRATLRADVPLRLIFEHPTVAEIGERVQAVRATPAPDIVRQPRRRGLPTATPAPPTR